MTDLDLDLDLDIEIEEEDVVKKKEASKQELKVKNSLEDLIDIKSSSNENNLFEKEKSLENLKILENDSQQKQIKSENFNNSSSESRDIQSNNLNTKMQGPIISWKDEVMKGNFMPAIYLLNCGKIYINDVVCPNTNNRILHFATTFSFLNVSRCLVEKFKADINLQNSKGHSPTPYNCK